MPATLLPAGFKRGNRMADKRPRSPRRQFWTQAALIMYGIAFIVVMLLSYYLEGSSR